MPTPPPHTHFKAWVDVEKQTAVRARAGRRKEGAVQVQSLRQACEDGAGAPVGPALPMPTGNNWQAGYGIPGLSLPMPQGWGTQRKDQALLERPPTRLLLRHKTLEFYQAGR